MGSHAVLHTKFHEIGRADIKNVVVGAYRSFKKGYETEKEKKEFETKTINHLYHLTGLVSHC